jgi:membrane protein YdbS with pleckstrin-like domain
MMERFLHEIQYGNFFIGMQQLMVLLLTPMIGFYIILIAFRQQWSFDAAIQTFEATVRFWPLPPHSRRQYDYIEIKGATPCPSHFLLDVSISNKNTSTQKLIMTRDGNAARITRRVNAFLLRHGGAPFVPAAEAKPEKAKLLLNETTTSLTVQRENTNVILQNSWMLGLGVTVAVWNVSHHIAATAATLVVAAVAPLPFVLRRCTWRFDCIDKIATLESGFPWRLEKTIVAFADITDVRVIDDGFIERLIVETRTATHAGTAFGGIDLHPSAAQIKAHLARA